MASWSFFALGTPAPQGSKRHVGNGVMKESSENLGPWREAVKAAAPAVPRALDGPLGVMMVFTVRRPKGAPKYKTLPDTRPDLSKLCRSTEDAITDAGLWVDDARVVSYSGLAKVWPSYPQRVDGWDLPVPGVIIAAYEMNGEPYGRWQVEKLFAEARSQAWHRVGRVLAS